jgi:hypothetical protein
MHLLAPERSGARVSGMVNARERSTTTVVKPDKPKVLGLANRHCSGHTG